MLASEKLKAFVATEQPGKAKAFYQEVLGLPLISEDNFGLEFDVNGAALRIAIVEKFTPQNFTCARMECKNIFAVIESLNKKIFSAKKFSFLPQDEAGVWVAPGGSKIAWFKDPDGNLLSLTE